MTDHADKSWLRSASYLAPDLRAIVGPVLFWIGAVSIVIGLHLWGTWIGKRDAMLVQQAERAAAIKLCAESGAVAYRQIDTGDLVCFSGSQRRAPLADPMKGK